MEFLEWGMELISQLDRATALSLLIGLFGGYMVGKREFRDDNETLQKNNGALREIVETFPTIHKLTAEEMARLAEENKKLRNDFSALRRSHKELKAKSGQSNWLLVFFGQKITALHLSHLALHVSGYARFLKFLQIVQAYVAFMQTYIAQYAQDAEGSIRFPSEFDEMEKASKDLHKIVDRILDALGEADSLRAVVKPGRFLSVKFPDVLCSMLQDDALLTVEGIVRRTTEIHKNISDILDAEEGPEEEAAAIT